MTPKLLEEKLSMARAELEAYRAAVNTRRDDIYQQAIQADPLKLAVHNADCQKLKQLGKKVAKLAAFSRNYP